MRRGCTCAVIGVLGLCIVACALGYLVGLPRLRDNIREPLEEVVGTQIARQVAPNPNVRPKPSTYVIREADLNAALRDELDQTDPQIFDDVTVDFAPSGFVLRFTASDNDVTYRGNVAAVNGRLAVTDMEADGWLTTFLPAKDVEKALEDVINDYLTTNRLRLTKAKLGNGTLTLTTEAA